jgi:hypothetical protein
MLQAFPIIGLGAALAAGWYVWNLRLEAKTLHSQIDHLTPLKGTYEQLLAETRTREAAIRDQESHLAAQIADFESEKRAWHHKTRGVVTSIKSQPPQHALSPFETQPKEILHLIFSYLQDRRDLGNLCQISTSMRQLAYQTIPHVYFREHYLRLLRDITKPFSGHFNEFNPQYLAPLVEGSTVNFPAFLSNLHEFFIEGRLPIDRASTFFNQMNQVRAAHPTVNEAFTSLPLFIWFGAPQSAFFVSPQTSLHGFNRGGEHVIQPLLGGFDFSPLEITNSVLSLECAHYTQDLLANPKLFLPISNYIQNIVHKDAIEYLRISTELYPSFQSCCTEFKNLKILHLYHHNPLFSVYKPLLISIDELVIENYSNTNQLGRSNILEISKVDRANNRIPCRIVRFLNGANHLRECTHIRWFPIQKIILHLPNSPQKSLKSLVNEFTQQILWQSFAISLLTTQIVELHSPYTGNLKESICLRRITRDTSAPRGVKIEDC